MKGHMAGEGIEDGVREKGGLAPVVSEAVGVTESCPNSVNHHEIICIVNDASIIITAKKVFHS